MSQNSILAIERDEASSKKITANLLPCRVHHTGPVNPTKAYWTPESNKDDTKSAYLRGRKLNGKGVTIPEGYRGVVLKRNDESQSLEQDEVDVQLIDGEIGKGEEGPRTGRMQVMTEFDEMVVWSHGDIPDGATDPYLRSVKEWLQFSSKIHSYEAPGGSK